MSPDDRSADRHTTPRRIISVGDDDWQRLGELVGQRGRAALIAEFIAWYVGRKGAKMPRRPRPE